MRTFMLALVLTIVILLLNTYKMRKTRTTWKKRATFLICGFIVAVLLGYLTQYVPRPMETVKIVASVQDENTKETSGTVFYSGIDVEGRMHQIKESSIKSGRWYWSGNSYGWTCDTNSSVSDKLSNEIQVTIPMGYNRFMCFKTGNNGGNVLVSTGNDKYSANLYSTEDGMYYLPIAASNIWNMRVYRGIILLIYLFVLITITAVIRKYVLIHSEVRLWKQLKESHKYNIAYVMIAATSMLFMICHANMESFWVDELFNLSIPICNIAPNSCFILMKIMSCIYEIMPYGQQYLLFWMELCVSISVVLIGMIGKKLVNGQVGIYSSALLGFSCYVYKQVGFEYRPYSALLLLGLVCYLLFIKRELKDFKNNYTFIILYGVSLLLLMDAHEFGKLVAGVFIAWDIMNVITRRMNWKNLISDLFPVAYVGYWIANNEVGGIWNNYSWTSTPTPQIVYNTLVELCGGVLLLIFMIIGEIIVCRNSIKRYCDRKRMSGKEYLLVVGISQIILIFTACIVYSTLINPENSLYVDRYFISVIAFMFLFAAIGIDVCFRFINSEKYKANRIIIAGLVTMIVFLYGWQEFNENPMNHPEYYRQAAEWINEQEDIYDKDTVIVLVGNQDIANVWEEYYRSEKGKRDHCNVTFSIDGTERYKKVYILWEHSKIDEEFVKKMKETYTLVDYVSQYRIVSFEKNE